MSAVESLTPSQITDAFLRDVPHKLLAALLRATLVHYIQSSEYCFTNLRPAQAKDLSGHHRRASIEDEWLGIADRFKPDVTAEELPYKRNTGSYVELTIGRVKMTQSCVLTKDHLPREADFRETLASTGQLGLFEGYGDVDRPETYCLYALLIHGVDTSVAKRKRCSFAYVRFPYGDCKSYIGGSIDIFAMFPEIVEEFYPKPVEEKDLALPLTAKKAKKAAGAE